MNRRENLQIEESKLWNITRGSFDSAVLGIWLTKTGIDNYRNILRRSATCSEEAYQSHKRIEAIQFSWDSGRVPNLSWWWNRVTFLVSSIPVEILGWHANLVPVCFSQVRVLPAVPVVAGDPEAGAHPVRRGARRGAAASRAAAPRLRARRHEAQVLRRSSTQSLRTSWRSVWRFHFHFCRGEGGSQIFREWWGLISCSFWAIFGQKIGSRKKQSEGGAYWSVTRRALSDMCDLLFVEKMFCCRHYYLWLTFLCFPLLCRSVDIPDSGNPNGAGDGRVAPNSHQDQPEAQHQRLQNQSIAQRARWVGVFIHTEFYNEKHQ